MTLQQAILLALQASIVLTVFGFGLQARSGHVLHVLRQPSLLARSFAAMFVIMPILAVAITRVFALDRAVEIALVALSISPIPPLLPGRETKAGGAHRAFALGLMAITGLASIVTVPVTLAIFGRFSPHPFGMSSAAIAKVVLMLAVLPLAAGLAGLALWPNVAARIAKPVYMVSRVLLVLAALVLLVVALPAAWALVGNGSLAAMTAFVAAGLAIGHWLGGPEADDRTVLAMSTASRHPAIALAIAKVNFPDEPRLGAAIVLFLLVNLLIGFPYLARQKQKRKISQ
jgi:bile acid:Na+ symporter, BASS family